MIRLTQEQMKAFSSLKGNQSFYKFTQLLEAEKELGITGLMTATPDKMQVLQGRVKLLDELLNLIQDIN